MKFFLLVLVTCSVAQAKCDIKPLKEEIISNYRTTLPVTNEKGEIGHATAKKFVVSNFLMKLKKDSFLIANFELDIKWLKGTTQTVKTLVVATVDLASCTIKNLENEETLAKN